MRYLVQIDLAKIEQVKSNLGAIKIGVVSQSFDYLSIDVPPELVSKVQAIPGVIAVTPERKVSIKQIFMPVDKKLTEFQRLFWSNPITGPAMAFKFSFAVDTGKQRVPTSESRKMMGADVAEAEGITGKGIKVAVLDTGTDVLGVQGSFLGGKSSVAGQPVQIDENGHGTHCASTVGGKPYQSIHGLLKGVAVDAEVVAFKVLGYGIGAGTESSILQGMQDALEWRADIISMSLGSDYTEEPPENIPECRVVELLTKQGIIVVIANGNSGPAPNTVGVAANSPYALSVGAVDIDRSIPEFSSRGPTAQGVIKPDVVAPGVNILSSSCGLIATMQFLDGPPKLAAISGTCLTGDSLVLLDGGYARKLSEINVGDIILTPFGRDIVLAFIPQGEADVYRLELEDGRYLEATAGHEFLVRSKKGTTWAKPSEYEWRELRELNPGDEVMVYRMTKVEAANLLWQDALLKEQLGDYDNPYIPQLTARGKRNPFYGRHHTQETIDKIGSVLKGRTAWNKGLTPDDERLRKALEVSQSHGFGTYERTPDILARLSASLKGRKVWNKGISPSAETRAKSSKAQLENLQNPEYRLRTIEWLREGLVKHLQNKPMTKGESFIVALLEALFPGEYKFNNGWFRLCGKYPDIVNVNGKKKLIEILGERWHSTGDEMKLKKLYSEVGYDCLVLWSRREIDKDPALVIQKVREFASNDMKERTKVRKVKSITLIGVKSVYDITTESHSFVANGFIVHNSMSTPHASGVVALALQYARMKGKNLTTDNIKEAMDLFGEYPGGAKNNDYGNGLITYQILKRYIDENLLSLPSTVAAPAEEAPVAEATVYE